MTKNVKIYSDPHILVTTSQSVVRIDPLSPRHASVIEAGRGLYYGLAPTTDNTVWIGARHSHVSDDIDSADEAGRLYELHASGANKASKPDHPLRDLHGMAMHRDCIWLTCSYDDAVAIYRPTSQTWSRWQPLEVSDNSQPDQYHFNTLLFEADLVWVVAHCRGPSWLLAFSIDAALAGRTTPPVKRVQLGVQAHNIWRHTDGTLCTCSSGEGKLISESGWELPTGGFPRGVSRLPDGWVVGVSELKERNERDFSDAKLLFYNTDWQLLNEVVLPKVGMVLDIATIPAGLQLPHVGALPLAAS